MPKIENPRLVAYLQLVDRASSLAFWLGVDGIRVTGLSVSLVKAIWDALDTGLSEHVIQTAVQIGEYRGQVSQNNISGDHYPLLNTHPDKNTFREEEYHPVVWITPTQIYEALSVCSDEIDQLSDLARLDLIMNVESAMREVYLTLLPDVILKCLHDLDT